MKDTEIHNGLSLKEIRDFLAISLMKIFKQEVALKKETITYDAKHPWIWNVKEIEAQVKFDQARLSFAREKQAILLIVEMNEWREHDVSDFISINTEYDYWMSFIGTGEEYITLRKSFED